MTTGSSVVRVWIFLTVAPATPICSNFDRFDLNANECGRWGPYSQVNSHRPGTAPAHGLLAGRTVDILSQTKTAKEKTITRSRFHPSVETLDERVA